MEIVVIVILLVLLGLLLWTLVAPRTWGRGGKPLDLLGPLGPPIQVVDRSDSSGKTRTCPICGHGLVRGQRIKSKIITLATAGMPRGGVKESLGQIYGCPFCWPHTPENPRVCPACKATLGPTDLVIGRYFEREGRDAQGRMLKNHFHVLGCTLCRKEKIHAN